MTDWVSRNSTHLGTDRIFTSPTATALYENTKAVADGVVGAPGSPWVLLEEQTVSAVATVDFDEHINSEFDEYLIELCAVRPATNAVVFNMRVDSDGGASYDTAANYLFAVTGRNVDGTDQANGSGVAADDAIQIAGGVTSLSSTAGRFLHGWIRLIRPAATETHSFEYKSWWDSGANSRAFIVGAGWYAGSTTPLNAFRLFMSSGNIAEGLFRLWGNKKTLRDSVT